MGASFKSAGYSDVDTMVTDCVGNEGAQLMCMARFLVSTGLDTALCVRNWTQLARGYNGPDYAANSHDVRLADSCHRFVDDGLPDLNVRAAQLGLVYRAWPVTVDGGMGPSTRAALADFQAREGLAVTRAPDAATLARLRAPPPSRALSAREAAT
jgi:peptidoglycan hydrolase-like protein with peptidoglycan-binding domain